MSTPKAQHFISPEDYLDGEQRSEIRHEYVAGGIYAMVGSSAAHNRIALNLATALNLHLRGGPCRVYMSDLKVRIGAAEAFYYPDVVVSCSPEDRQASAYYLSHPTLIVEVLSPSTERIDREEKRERYQRIESLEEYVLVAQEPPRVEVYRRGAGVWEVEVYGADDRFTLRAVGLELAVMEIFAEV